MPYSRDDLFSVFAAYNNAIWPAQLFLVAVASIAVFFAAVPQRRKSRYPVTLLAMLWIWSGVIYHVIYLRLINTAALISGALFVLEAGLLMFAYHRDAIVLKAGATPTGVVGWILAAYGVTGYQISTEIARHYYPNAQTFGAPCPLVIFTFGMLLWNTRKTPWYILVIPVTWSLIVTIGAFSTGMFEDLALTLAALLVLYLSIQPRLHFGHPLTSRGSP